MKNAQAVLIFSAKVVPCTFQLPNFLLNSCLYFAEPAPPMVFLASRRVKKEDMRRIAKSTGASIVTTLADMEGNETFDPSVLGEADEVSGRDIQH